MTWRRVAGWIAERHHLVLICHAAIAAPMSRVSKRDRWAMSRDRGPFELAASAALRARRQHVRSPPRAPHVRLPLRVRDPPRRYQRLERLRNANKPICTPGYCGELVSGTQRINDSASDLPPTDGSTHLLPSFLIAVTGNVGHVRRLQRSQQQGIALFPRESGSRHYRVEAECLSGFAAADVASTYGSIRADVERRPRTDSRRRPHGRRQSPAVRPTRRLTRAVCARGQAAIQFISPRPRIVQPPKRTGERGAGIIPGNQLG